MGAVTVHTEAVTAHIAPVTIRIEASTFHTDAVTAHIEDLTAHTATTKVHIEAVTVHIEDETAHIGDETSYTASTTVHMPPFEPTATAYEKMAKPFYLFQLDHEECCGLKGLSISEVVFSFMTGTKEKTTPEKDKTLKRKGQNSKV